MVKARNPENDGLPSGWRHYHSAYYYRVPSGLEKFWDGKKQFKLGDNLSAAYKEWASRLAGYDNLDECVSIGELLDRYARDVIPKKSLRSQDSNINQLKMLRKVFGQMPLLPMPPKTVYTYVDMRSKKKKNPETGRVTGGRVMAHREIELLSHAYTKAVEWGFLDRHPFKGEIRLEGEAPRTRYIEDAEIIEMLSITPLRKSGSVKMIQGYLRLKLLTGIAQGDLLRLEMKALLEEGIYVLRHKTEKSSGVRTIYSWTPELRKAIEMIQEARPKKLSPYLFCTREGKSYVSQKTGMQSGWKSMWQRFVARVMEETDVTQTFTEHDLRAKVGSDANSLEHAQALLQHADSRTTKRVYRRKAEVVKPLR